MRNITFDNISFETPIKAIYVKVWLPIWFGFYLKNPTSALYYLKNVPSLSLPAAQTNPGTIGNGSISDITYRNMYGLVSLSLCLGTGCEFTPRETSFIIHLL